MKPDRTRNGYRDERDRDSEHDEEQENRDSTAGLGRDEGEDLVQAWHVRCFPPAR